jgi:hypothetical protein
LIAASLRDEPVRVAVGRDHHLVGFELVEGRDPLVLAKLGAGFRGARG